VSVMSLTKDATFQSPLCSPRWLSVLEKSIGVILLYLLFDTGVLSITLAVDAGEFKNNRIRGVPFGQSEIVWFNMRLLLKHETCRFVPGF